MRQRKRRIVSVQILSGASFVVMEIEFLSAFLMMPGVELHKDTLGNAHLDLIWLSTF